jgi:TolB-like protein/Tfp pilus assembly protein PilF
MPQKRQLAAIMFTDIVGYTALMGDDEHKAFETLQENRELQKPLIKNRNGRWIKELGDGILSSIENATDAVFCAIEIQKACNEKHDFKLRIGIHLAEVVFEDDDIFGDGVNIASRIQSQAGIGTIHISESVRSNVANKKEIVTKFIREETLKNVKEPVRIYEVILEKDHSSSNGKANGKSIAVLPFVNMSNDPNQEYFSDGMAEEILNTLTHLSDLKVAGRTSSFQFKGKNTDLREVGQKLNVATVLEGSVRKSGNKLRITAQLVSVEDGYHIWSERYDREMDDVFAIQDEIALAIAEKLKITLLKTDIQNINKIPTQVKEAYELYLKGRFYINKRGTYLLKGLQCFQEAIALDENFALAHASFADASLLLAFYNIVPAKDVMPKVKLAAETAIKINGNLSEPYTSLGFYYGYFEWNNKKSTTYFQKALELNPKYAQGYSWYALFYLAWIEGDFKKADKYAQIAIELEPLSPIVRAIEATIYYTSNKFEEAIRVGNIGVELDANSYLSYRMIGLSAMELGRLDEAIENFKRAIEISNRFQWAVSDLIYAYCRKGNFEEANILMNELKDRSTKENICYTYLGLCAAYLGNLDEAIEYLEKSFLNREPVLLTFKIKNIPTIPAILRNDSRFQNILSRIVLS